MEHTYILWYDLETARVKIAKHARFDEGMNDLPTDQIPPNVVHLQRTQNGEEMPAEKEESSVDEFYFSANPFSHTLAKELNVKCKNQNFGFGLATD